nr:discoidin domain-containing protein [Puia sp.]
DGRLVITVNSWEKFSLFGDEIIEVHTAGRPFLLSPEGWAITASEEDINHPAADAIDSTQHTYYSSATLAQMPVGLRIDMGKEQHVGAILLHQNEARALTTARYCPEGEGTRIKDYEVYTSSDGLHWGTAVTAGQLENERGVKEIILPRETPAGRYIELKVLSNYKGDGLVQITGIDLIKK